MATADEYAAAAWAYKLPSGPAGALLNDTYLNASAAKDNADVAKQWSQKCSAQVEALAAQIDEAGGSLDVAALLVVLEPKVKEWVAEVLEQTSVPSVPGSLNVT